MVPFLRSREIAKCYLRVKGTQRRFPPTYIENTFQAIQSTFRSLEMHSEGRYKICICSAIHGQLESVRNYQVFSITFPINFRCNLTFNESKKFFILIPLSIAFLNPKILGFLFTTKNSLTWGVKYEKLNFRKSQGIIKINFENCT